MINLIPQSAKKSILIEYWVRVATVWVILFSTAMLIGALIFLPTYVLISSQVAVYEESAAEATQKVENYENVSVSLIQASQQAKIIIDETETPLFSDYIDLFESKQGQGIHVSEINLSREGKGVGPSKLVGVASDRQTLASFRDRLLDTDEITSVDLPISNLASDSNIQFTLTVTFNNDGV